MGGGRLQEVKTIGWNISSLIQSGLVYNKIYYALVQIFLVPSFIQIHTAAFLFA